MATKHNVETSFEMSDGRIFKCEYSFVYYPSTYWEPDDCDVGEPTFSIDDEEVKYEDLPKGLDSIADRMYEAGKGEFNYKEESDNGDDYYDFD